MALEDKTQGTGANEDWVAFEVLASATATNSPPASATAGIDIVKLRDAFGGVIPADLSLVCISTAGSATMTVTLKAWMRFGTLGAIATGAWCPVNINGGSAIAEAATDVIRFAEPLSLSGHADRLYIEIAAIGGTLTAVTCFLVGRKQYAVGRA